MNHLPIYLDYNATTPVDPLAAQTLEPWLRERFGNPSSAHLYGKDYAISFVANAAAAEGNILHISYPVKVYIHNVSSGYKLIQGGVNIGVRLPSGFAGRKAAGILFFRQKRSRGVP